jgi:hypothetical protein
MQRQVARKAMCKVCVDAGKNEEEYSSHWVKDKNGKVVCPTLLNQECRFCHKFGHTPKFCPLTKETNKNTKRDAYKREMNSREVASSAKGVEKSRFVDLESSDEESEKEWPELPTNKVNSVLAFGKDNAIVPIENGKRSYKSSLVKKLLEDSDEELSKNVMTREKKKAIPTKPVLTRQQVEYFYVNEPEGPPPPLKKKSWVEMEEDSSDSDED